jgi:hypothetical protein
MAEAEATAQPDAETPGPLLSIRDVSRRLGHPLETIAHLVSQGLIPAVDGGQLAQAKKYDVGVVRQERLAEIEEEWAKGSGSKRIDVDYEPGAHPAIQSALGFMDALWEKEAALVAFLSTERTRAAAESADDLLQRWQTAMPADLEKKGGVASAVYPFPENPNAALVRLPYTDSEFSYTVNKAVPLNVAAVLPLIEEDGVYRADLPLFERQEVLIPHAGTLKTDDAG